MQLACKILVVDDEPQIQLLLEDFLTGLGHTVRVAGDGDQALQSLRMEAFDGVLADLKMAKLSGIELLRSIKLSYPTLPVIMITGYPSVEVAVEAMKEGAVDFITKPLHLDALRPALARITGDRLPHQLNAITPPTSTNSGSSPVSSLLSKDRELSILYAICEAFQTLTDAEAIFPRLVQVAREIVGAHCASFTILDCEPNGTPRKTLKAGDEDYLLEVRPSLDNHILDQLLKARKPLLFNDEQPGIVVPVFIKNELLGILSVWEKQGRFSFTEADVLLLLTLCRKAALSLENQFLYESLYENLLETLKALVATLEARDPYTRAHSQRVSRYATALAAKMGCSKEEQDIITVAGYLHDIGKIGVCDAILLKTEPLTLAEYEVIKSHPIIGEQIVQPLGYFAREKSIIRHHHEWWDGRGYPDALMKHQIPFLARLLTVADAFDAITTNRPYRAGRPFGDALEELECWAGIQFDMEAVAAFRHVIQQDSPIGALMR
ncbi:MAG TPA: HD domain-containing phosphohydrolase [Candidatus Tectomicrobia bacterium]|nr:HD domain-containing phosphohydrolase [Candidatus Tectomicrobia bacterium]